MIKYKIQALYKEAVAVDNVKGTITRRMDAVLNELQDEFNSIYCIEDFESKLEALKQAGSKSGRSSRLRSLFDLFDRCGIEYERGKDNEYYEKLISGLDIPTLSEIEDKMLLVLFSMYEEYPSPEDYMKRIVNRLCSDEDGWSSDTLRLRILKQFIKYGNYLVDAGFGGRKVIGDYVKNKIGKKPAENDVLEQLDDGVFSALTTAAAHQRRPEGKYGLLKLCDDLAGGKFRTEGATKRGLYLFAMVYGMTYYPNEEERDVRSDVEINLFHDYYVNNLMRFISDEYKGKLCEYELDPSGQGINYKNFEEMIYLYYIAKDISPQDKIKLSNEMINCVEQSCFKQGRTDTYHTNETVFYEDLFNTKVLSLDEKEFEEFICDNYDCDVYDGSYETKNGIRDRRKNKIQLKAEQNSAADEYNSIIEALGYRGIDLKSCSYGLWFTDVEAFKQRDLENICDRQPDIDIDKFKEFIELLCATNNFMTKALDSSSSKSVTRTSIVTAYYYYYNATHSSVESNKQKSFEEVFNSFKAGIDHELEEAHYQKLSDKNIFDVLVVFSAYAYLIMG